MDADADTDHVYLNQHLNDGCKTSSAEHLTLIMQT